MNVLRKRWFAVLVCVLMVAMSLLIGFGEEGTTADGSDNLSQMVAADHPLQALLRNPISVSRIAGVVFFAILLILLLLAAAMAALFRIFRKISRRMFQANEHKQASVHPEHSDTI